MKGKPAGGTSIEFTLLGLLPCRRFTRWLLWNGTTLTADWDGPYRDELYDHEGDDGTDFDSFENADTAADNPDVVEQYAAVLRAQFAPA